MNMRRVGAMIGSPSDATAERDAVASAILQWNAHSGRSMNVFLEPVRWETHATPGLLGRPQGMINEELIPLSDILIAMFHARAGSPTGVDVSGTIEEIREFMGQGKVVIVYFFAGDVPIDSVDPDQLAAIRKFRQDVQKQGITAEYKSVDDLRAQLSHHLSAIVSRVIGDSAVDTSNSGSVLGSLPTDPLPVTSSPISSTSKQHTSSLVVSDSGRWALLESRFYETQSVRQSSDGSWAVEIRSDSAEVDAHLSSLKPQPYGRARPMAFAHRNEGLLVRVDSVESVSQGENQVWTVTLTPEEVQYGGGYMEVTYKTDERTYSPDDFARLRAGRILLNDPAPLKDDNKLSTENKISQAMLESYIRGTDNPVSVKHCIVRSIHKDHGHDAATFLRLARLASIYFLKAGGVAERVLDLTLGPIESDRVHVQFRGVRRQVDSNVAPSVIEIEGDCPL